MMMLLLLLLLLRLVVVERRVLRFRVASECEEKPSMAVRPDDSLLVVAVVFGEAFDDVGATDGVGRQVCLVLLLVLSPRSSSEPPFTALSSSAAVAVAAAVVRRREANENLLRGVKAARTFSSLLRKALASSWARRTSYGGKNNAASAICLSRAWTLPLK